VPLAFSFPAIIVKKETLIKQLEITSYPKHISDFSSHILNSNLNDEYLIGIETMSNVFDTEIQMLNELGLVWNDGTEAIDFYITNQGTYSANWLSYGRVVEFNNNRKHYFPTYKHTKDYDYCINTFDECLKSKFPTSSTILDRKHWASIAKDEGNKLHKPSIDDFMYEITKNNRVCPNPSLWNDLHTVVVEANFNENTPPNLPLILGAWGDCDFEKAVRLRELINWCYLAEVADIAWAFIKSLKENEWHYKS
jgi:hypothetical protein